MNFIVKEKLFILSIIVFIVKLNYFVLGQDNSDSSSSTDKIGTFRSIPEAIAEELISDVEGGSNSSSIITRTFSDILESIAGKIKVIFPGTQWCGSGDDATNSSVLGYFDRTDYCCRNHDNCPGTLSAGQSVGPLINNGIFTRSTCSCDEAFHKCLSEVNSTVSSAIGTTYFNLLRPQCYIDDYPIESCAKTDSFRLLNKKCLEYNYNTTLPPTLEWKDNPDF